jgi:hypothetical protein
VQAPARSRIITAEVIAGRHAARCSKAGANDLAASIDADGGVQNQARSRRNESVEKGGSAAWVREKRPLGGAELADQPAYCPTRIVDSLSAADGNSTAGFSSRSSVVLPNACVSLVNAPSAAHHPTSVINIRCMGVRATVDLPHPAMGPQMNARLPKTPLLDEPAT